MTLVWRVSAQTNEAAFSLFDAPPIDGVGDSLTGGFTIGEVNQTGFPFAGLSRAELIIQLPAMPPGASLNSATLSVYLEQSSDTNGNPTFGPLSVYHNPQHTTFAFNTTDYADTNFVLVTNSFVAPGAPGGRYYSLDVTPQVAQDYTNGASPPVATFRFQVDGLQYRGGTHWYNFYFADPRIATYPVQLTVSFAVPLRPVLSGYQQIEPPAFVLHWPANAGNFNLESADTMTGPVWNPVGAIPLVLSNENWVAVPIDGNQKFFRLHLQ